jgi:hypothetical protein
MRNRSPMRTDDSSNPSIVKFSGGIDVDRLVRPAVNAQIGLLVAFEIVRSQHEAARHRLFVDAGADDLSPPVHRTRTPT